mmetsp:Transcript_28078/g.69454  ORF Transcript_28078/g.69454 Transcript_28078/m.69454 type:complete len:120 (-) Transcript_28078:358-717(-)
MDQDAAQRTASWTHNERAGHPPSPEQLGFLQPPPAIGGGDAENEEPNPILGWFEEIGKRLDKAKRDIFCCDSGRHSGMCVRSSSKQPVKRAYGSLRDYPVPTANIYMHSAAKNPSTATV